MAQILTQACNINALVEFSAGKTHKAHIAAMTGTHSVGLRGLGWRPNERLNIILWLRTHLAEAAEESAALKIALEAGHRLMTMSRARPRMAVLQGFPPYLSKIFLVARNEKFRITPSRGSSRM
jgi:hypothetical protein